MSLEEKKEIVAKMLAETKERIKNDYMIINYK